MVADGVHNGDDGMQQSSSTITHPSCATDVTLAPPSVCNPEGIIRRGTCYGVLLQCGSPVVTLVWFPTLLVQTCNS
jgi:hypothetical protein